MSHGLPRWLSRHFTPGELREALSGGLRTTERCRAVLHFGAWRCETCWRRLHELADSLAGLSSMTEILYDPVSAALLRLAAYRHSDAAGAEALLAGLRLAHRHWLHQAGETSFGFGRLVLEESRRQARERPASALATAWATHELFERLPPGPFGERAYDLRGLARLYLADVLSSSGVHSSAHEHFSTASDTLARGSGDPELRARWLELTADDLLAQGRDVLAHFLLRLAYARLASVAMPGRRADNLTRQGVALVACRQPAAARAPLRLAARQLARLEPSFPRLLALHYLAFAELSCRRHADAERRLRAAVPLYAEYGTPLLRAQRAWLEGVVALRTERFQEAARRLRDATGRFRALGREGEVKQIEPRLNEAVARSG